MPKNFWFHSNINYSWNLSQNTTTVPLVTLYYLLNYTSTET